MLYKKNTFLNWFEWFFTAIKKIGTIAMCLTLASCVCVFFNLKLIRNYLYLSFTHLSYRVVKSI